MKYEDTSRYFLVRLDPGLDESRVAGIWHSVTLTPGVKCVLEAEFATGLVRDRLNWLTGIPIPKGTRRAPKVQVG